MAPIMELFKHPNTFVDPGDMALMRKAIKDEEKASKILMLI